ncbi:energy transducer TonB [Lacinutrix gracilariae]|uniref:Energy transducer TonB n=1 Tax=Lacinutrix gracilariae TaxID=1747198 RepID=A0ABW5K2T1_9FLAO
MRNQMKSRDLNGQKEENVKKSQKHDANLQKNTTIYFQVGLIVCLLFSYVLLEMEFASKNYVIEFTDYIEEPTDYVPEKFKIYKEEKIASVKKKKPTVFTNPVVSDDDSDTIETSEIITEPLTTNTLPTELDFSDLLEEPEEQVILSVDFVEVVPVFPGCENATNNAERKACMSKRIAKHIQKYFDTDIANDLGLSGRQRINVGFKINSNGEITEVTAISKHKALKLEAEEVIGKLPKMKPGKQHNKNVSVVYSQPIIFNAQN